MNDVNDPLARLPESVTREQRLSFRDELRHGRALALADAESASALVFSIERLGAFVTQRAEDLGWVAPKVSDGLGKYTQPLAALFRGVEGGPRQATPERLLDLVRHGRNEALHHGASARVFVQHCVELAVWLEEALMTSAPESDPKADKKKAPTALEFAVTGVIRAESWQHVSALRHQMLANQFSYLPFLVEGAGVADAKWRFVSEAGMARFLRVKDHELRKKRMKLPLARAIADGLTTEKAATAVSSKAPWDVLEDMQAAPVLIVDDEDETRLLGIVTAHDLL